VTSPTDPADHATGTASLFKVGGTYQNAGGLQIAIPATGVPWTAGNQLKVTLGGGGTTSAGDPVVTFAKVPNNATVSQRGIAASDLDTRAGYSGTHATQGTAIGTAPTTAIKAPTAKLNPADHSELDITLPDPNGASATGVFLLSLDGIQISVAQGTSLADQVVTATVSSADVTVAGTTTLGYISPYVLSTSGDTTTTNGVVSVPSVLLSEALKNVFADGVADTTFTLQVAGTNVDSTHPIAFAEAAANSLKGASTTSGATVENSAIAAGDDTVDFKVTAGSDTKLETISLSGLKVVNSKPGTDITLSIVSDLNVADNGGSTGFAFAPDQSAGASVTLTASEKLPRIAGSNRYATAADVADLGNWDGDAVVLANGLDAKNGADALSASFLAGVKGAPILLADSSNTLPEATTDALKKLFKDSGAEVTIYVMGKTDSVSQAARDAALAAVKSTLNPVGTAAVVEVAGNDRYETSTASLSKAGASAVATANLGKGNLRTAFLASGTVNADALAAAGISAGARIPVLLTTNGDALPNSVASAIKDQHIDQIIILGATDRVSQKVEDALTADGVNVVRVAGANRFETAVDLSTLARANPTDGLGFNAGGTAYLANGLTGWVDALSVGPLAGQAGGAVLTVDGSASLPTSTATYLKNKDTTLTSVQALGSTDRITDSAVTEAAKAVVK
jgi:putative cell wall-binding protein